MESSSAIMTLTTFRLVTSPLDPPLLAGCASLLTDERRSPRLESTIGDQQVKICSERRFKSDYRHLHLQHASKRAAKELVGWLFYSTDSKISDSCRHERTVKSRVLTVAGLEQ
jgi:hypothetical protein